jgi:hypothetical protein
MSMPTFVFLGHELTCVIMQGFVALRDAAQEISPEWPQQPRVKDVQRRAAAAGYSEPTLEMVTEFFLGRQQTLTWENADVAFDGRIRRVLGHIDSDLDGASCCRSGPQCSLGR